MGDGALCPFAGCVSPGRWPVTFSDEFRDGIRGATLVLCEEHAQWIFDAKAKVLAEHLDGNDGG